MRACCTRCGAALYGSAQRTLRLQWIMVWSSAVMLVVANSLPILTLQVYSARLTTSLPGAIALMFGQHEPIVALLVFLCALGLPALEIGAQLYLLFSLMHGRRPAGYRGILRTLQLVRPWSMVEVFMIGALVTFSKLSSIADVAAGAGLWSFALLTLLLTWVNAAPPQLFWNAVAACGPRAEEIVLRPESGAAAPVTAAGAALLACQFCGLLSRRHPAVPGTEAACPRCGGVLHQRQPQSLARTWTYLAAAVILYVPANTLTVMRTTSIAGVKNDTILSGVVFLWNTGSWYLAIIVFIASIIVPILKISALALLSATAQKRSGWQCGQRSRLYRLVDLIGRWSMLDLFVVTLMAALVRQRTFAYIVAGPAAAAFGIVVVLTILASHSFDPRLTWDACDASAKGRTA